MKNLLLILFVSLITTHNLYAQSGKLKKADGYYELLSYTLAIQSYTDLLSTDLANAEMKAKLAHSYFNVNDFLNSEKYYNEAVKMGDKRCRWGNCNINIVLTWRLVLDQNNMR